MNPTQLAEAITGRGRTCAAKNATHVEFQDAYLVGWLQEELTNALQVLSATDSLEAKRYLSQLQERCRNQPKEGQP